MAIRNGLFSKAVSALESGSMVAPSEEASLKLQTKHPPALHPLDAADFSVLPAPCQKVTEEVVDRSLRSFNKGTSARGLRAQHLLDGLLSGYSSSLKRDLTKAVNLFLSGQVPREFAPFVAGASLFALDKTKDGVFDVRPIAAGEIIRRLVAKCLCATHKKDAERFFEPAGQFGVACASGAERVIHRTRFVVSQVISSGHPPSCESKSSNPPHEHIEPVEPDFIILKVDLRNAFNKVSRFHMLRLVCEHFPGLARWVHWCYGSGEDPYLWFDKWTLRSKEGVQQGDPLGPLLFSLAIQQIINTISEECPGLDLNQWYLDDGVIAGKHDEVLKAFNIIQKMGPPLGMDLNIKKNELVKFSSKKDDFPVLCKRFFKKL